MTRRELMSILLAVVVLICTVVLLYSPIRLRLLVALGLGQGCTVERALEAATNPQRIRSVKDHILSASKKVAQVGAYAQWNTPDGLYWIPVRNQYTLPFNLAKQEIDITHSARTRQTGRCRDGLRRQRRCVYEESAERRRKTGHRHRTGAENIDVLKRNFATEIRQDRVIVYPKGVWDKEDTLILHEHFDNSAADSFVINLEQDKKTVHASDEKLP